MNMTIEEKSLTFYTALIDCYKNKDAKEMLKIRDDMTDDIVSMLLALNIFVRSFTDMCTGMNLIEFTNLLNGLATQYVTGCKETENEANPI